MHAPFSMRPWLVLVLLFTLVDDVTIGNATAASRRCGPEAVSDYCPPVFSKGLQSNDALDDRQIANQYRKKIAGEMDIRGLLTKLSSGRNVSEVHASSLSYMYRLEPIWDDLQTDQQDAYMNLTGTIANSLQPGDSVLAAYAIDMSTQTKGEYFWFGYEPATATTAETPLYDIVEMYGACGLSLSIIGFTDTGVSCLTPESSSSSAKGLCAELCECVWVGHV
eukprot:Blabericola_migrator_1__1709@NODE_145_length_12990_cov_99_814439_g126_i0_p6_GENE_NODE_145_length_12990_cov_99_814439_g126_i0NODE_145_length_12990_cov_99_814439_g126_i0_p6_ORF_typecomplete_len222_score23_97DUF4537/PF15057_6/0_3_NODE_145_length_12990_cov_99_814439_g126_i078508515